MWIVESASMFNLPMAVLRLRSPADSILSVFVGEAIFIFVGEKICFGTIHILRQHIFWHFLTHPLCQHEYSTERQQNCPFSRPTHPPSQPHSPFADVIYEWSLSKQCAAVASRDHAMIDGCKDKTLAHKLQH